MSETIRSTAATCHSAPQQPTSSHHFITLNSSLIIFYLSKTQTHRLIFATQDSSALFPGLTSCSLSTLSASHLSDLFLPPPCFSLNRVSCFILQALCSERRPTSTSDYLVTFLASGASSLTVLSSDGESISWDQFIISECFSHLSASFYGTVPGTSCSRSLLLSSYVVLCCLYSRINQVCDDLIIRLWQIGSHLILMRVNLHCQTCSNMHPWTVCCQPRHLFQ